VPLHGVGGCCNKGKRRNRDEKNEELPHFFLPGSTSWRVLQRPRGKARQGRRSARQLALVEDEVLDRQQPI
jgi:hypothetical protein